MSAGRLSGKQLYARLAAWRLDQARLDGVAAYAICSPKTLREIAAVQPADAEALAHVWGFGSARVERHGAAILAIVNTRLS